MQASEAANTALAAITNAANTVGNTLAWWGTYITDIVAEVTGDSNEPSEEDVQKQEQQRYTTMMACTFASSMHIHLLHVC